MPRTWSSVGENVWPCLPTPWGKRLWKNSTRRITGRRKDWPWSPWSILLALAHALLVRSVLQTHMRMMPGSSPDKARGVEETSPLVVLAIWLQCPVVKFHKSHQSQIKLAYFRGDQNSSAHMPMVGEKYSCWKLGDWGLLLALATGVGKWQLSPFVLGSDCSCGKQEGGTDDLQDPSSSVHNSVSLDHEIGMRSCKVLGAPLLLGGLE